MRKNRFFLLAYLFISLRIISQEKENVLAIIPKPSELKMLKGNFKLSDSTNIVIQNLSSCKNEADFFNEYLEKQYGFKLKIVSNPVNKNNYIEFKNADWETKFTENYELLITENKISIVALEKSAGNFYAIQTLIQTLPIEKNIKLLVSCLKIKDAPRFKWRGMHLDVCRHFFPKPFIKKYIDLMAMYKMNTFHWHLTEDQAWRIEIKKYPKLTQVGAWRKGTMVGAYKDQKYDTIPYGGFYTQDDIKEIVAYAEKRHITIVPEIEMPGHSVAAITSYPWLSCRGKQIEVEKSWGVFEDVFCTKDSTFKFLEDVLDEVMELFPSPYIHIGGDECPKTRWKTCAQCQSIIKKENLKDEHELQSYFIKRIEKYVNLKGRQIIGWDEILEGGLAPNAAVMSWRGIDGGIAAAKQKHHVVMSPGTHCYFDHYQSSPTDEPLAIGGFTPLEKVYAFEPVPTELNNEEQKYILGAQANVWTEYILNEKQVEYMAMPRMAALSEVLWTPKELKNETNFLERLQKHFLLLDQLDVNYAKALYNVKYTILPNKKTQQLELELNANAFLGTVYYTLEGSNPTINSSKYTNPIELKTNTTVKAGLYKNNELKGKISFREYHINKATNKFITFKTPPSKYYNIGGGFTLVNSVVATLPRVNDQWLGWSGNDLETVVDLGKEEDIQSIQIGFLNEELNWIYLPKLVEFFISKDGINYKAIQKVTTNELKQERFAISSFPSDKAKYVKIIAKTFGKIESGKPGAGEDAWLFCDEIIIK